MSDVIAELVPEAGETGELFHVVRYVADIAGIERTFAIQPAALLHIAGEVRPGVYRPLMRDDLHGVLALLADATEPDAEGRYWLTLSWLMGGPVHSDFGED